MKTTINRLHSFYKQDIERLELLAKHRRTSKSETLRQLIKRAYETEVQPPEPETAPSASEGK